MYNIRDYESSAHGVCRDLGFSHSEGLLKISINLTAYVHIGETILQLHTAQYYSLTCNDFKSTSVDNLPSAITQRRRLF